MIKLEIYTDGACNQVAKTGGWSFILLEDGKEKVTKSGSEVDTTNNQCEMLAVIKAFEELETIEFFQPISITLFSDSAYVVNAFKDDWISKWINSGWLNAEKKPVKNKELWESIIFYQQKYKADFVQVKRRSNDYAKKVDDMAKKPSLNKPA